MENFIIDSNIPHLSQILIEDSERKNIKNRTVRSFSSGEITKKELIKFDANYLIVRSTVQVNKELLAGTNVKFVATATTGFEHIDLNYLAKKGIKFFAAIGANSNSVAEYVIYSILFFGNKIGFENLSKLTVGIIGFGNIGKKVAKYLEYMKINYVINDPFISNSKDNLENNKNNLKNNFCEIENLIKNCEIITTHVPLTFDGEFPTYNLLNSKRINSIKSNSLLICTSRGGICDEKAMLERKNELFFAVDVWENEPFVKNRELINFSLISTPHIAGHSHNGKFNGTKMIVEELNRIYDLNLSISEENLSTVSENIKEKNIFSQQEMTNYSKLFAELNKNRKLIATNDEMKSKINLSKEEFSSYFKTVRKNYPKTFEILQPNF